MEKDQAASPGSPVDLLRRTYNGTDWLDRIEAAEKLRTLINDEQVSAVIGARREAESWASIGKVLGLTRQGAFNRFGGLIQRYERTGLLARVDSDEGLEMNEQEARAHASELIASIGRGGPPQPADQ